MRGSRKIELKHITYQAKEEVMMVNGGEDDDGGRERMNGDGTRRSVIMGSWLNTCLVLYYRPR